jgi:signal transduction histidine kinase
VNLLDDVLVFAAGIYAFVGAHAVLTRIRQRGRELSILDALSVALFIAAIARLLASRFGAELASRVHTAVLPLAFALVDQLAIGYGRLPHRRAWLAFAYGTAIAIAVLDAAGLVAPEMAMPAALLLGAFAVVLLLAVCGRAFLAARRDALALVVAGAVLLAAVLNDLALAAGAFDTVRLVMIGFLPLVFAVSRMLLGRLWGVGDELKRSTEALRLRTRELRRSYGDLRQTQAELVKQQQLAAVGELAAVIAHEVRNPLAVVSNAVAGLKKDGLARDDHATLLTILEEEVGRLNRLVTDLLGYARPVSLQRTQLAVDELVERALGLPRTKLGLTVLLEKQVQDTRIWADASHLRQVLDNLLDNAVQAMAGDGTLTVRLREAKIDGIEGLGVDVVDTGEGMDTTVRKRAKDPFFTTRPSGTGLGLAIVDRIVEAHGGRFVIESHAGEGTTATVLLPYGRASEPPAESSRRSVSEATAAARKGVA